MKFVACGLMAPDALVGLCHGYWQARKHVLMIAIAYFYQVDSLKTAARTKFAKCHLDWHKLGFLELAKTIYTWTPNRETYLREAICGLASAHSEDLKGDDIAGKAMTAHPALAINLFHAAVEYGKVQLERHKGCSMARSPPASRIIPGLDLDPAASHDGFTTPKPVARARAQATSRVQAVRRTAKSRAIDAWVCA